MSHQVLKLLQILMENILQVEEIIFHGAFATKSFQNTRFLLYVAIK